LKLANAEMSEPDAKLPIGYPRAWIGSQCQHDNQIVKHQLPEIFSQCKKWHQGLVDVTMQPMLAEDSVNSLTVYVKSRVANSFL
jgi:hypothetical protein